MLCVTTWVKFKGKKLVYLDLSTPLELIGRSREFQRIVEVLAIDGDLLIAGVPGSGRRTLVCAAAKEVNAVVMEIDCIRATDGERFVQLLAETIGQNFNNRQIQTWVKTDTSEYFVFENEAGSKLKLLRGLNQKQLWQAFEFLLKLPQQLAEDDDKRGVLILYAFPHIRSWDRSGLWEATFRREIKVQTRISYVLIATIAETNNHAEESDYPLEVLELAPLEKDIIAVWARGILHTQGLTFDPRSKALQLFLEAIQGNIGDAMALIRRLQGIHRPNSLITEQAVQEAIDGLLKDLSMTFESLLMLLPPNQVHLLESLACNPTEKPQSREYIQKHGLSRGGSLQGALMGLQHKGLIYSAEQRYQLALPLLALWLRQRLG
ncbi:MAG: ATP-binding protein [Methylacidiphilales bacterium]|nr:ATP-binding protein [Candidatus Methylacidiphilales bacterium]NJR18119.1 ATP-binding protein [Calothrix sp. CSU_2_0]